MARFTITGDAVTNPSAEGFNGATAVRIVATGATVTGSVQDANAVQLGQFYLHAAGDEIVVSKRPTDTITAATSIGHPVGVGG